MPKHWADDREGFELVLPVGTTVLLDAEGETPSLVLWLKPMHDQPSAREELARALEQAASVLRQWTAPHTYVDLRGRSHCDVCGRRRENHG